MRPSHRATAVLVALGLLVSGCYGPFTLTKNVHHWNGQVSNDKWVVEVVFLVCAWLPVYGIATLADAVIFNSVEFWTGKNPLNDSTAEATPTRRLVRGNDEAVLARDGQDLVIRQFHQGAEGATLRLRREANGIVGMNQDGAVLMHATTLADGRVIVTDAQNRQIAAYSGDQAEQFLASLPQ